MSSRVSSWPAWAAAITVLAMAPQAVRGQSPPAASPNGAGQSSATAVSEVTVVAHRPAAVSELDITAKACPDPDPARFAAVSAPRVIDSYPAQDAAVPPGLAMVRITFDAPMACYFDVVSEAASASGADLPTPCRPAGAWQLPGRTTWRMACTLQPGATYKLRFGQAKDKGFYGLSGRRADGFTLRFTTSDAPPVASVAAAFAADPGPPSPERTVAYVTCTDQRYAPGGVPCVRKGVRPGAPPPLL